jgi:uncharacterized protein (DUF1697 family)
MEIFVAFLRGVNVSGQKIIQMKELKLMFENAGFKNVKTFIQSGNVIFESAIKEQETIKTKIETFLNTSLGYKVDVLLRSFKELKILINKNPFNKIQSDNNIKPYVTFTSGSFQNKIKLPLESSKKDIEIIQQSGLDFFSLSKKINGKFGFPNSFIEKEFKVTGTTRGWPTVMKIFAILLLKVEY